MSRQIVLKAKSATGDHVVPMTMVKNGRKIEAKIYPPNKFHDYFGIEMNGLGFARHSLVDALEFVRKSVEDRINAFGASSVTVTIERVK